MSRAAPPSAPTAVYASLLAQIGVICSLRSELGIPDWNWHNLPICPKEYTHANA